MSGWQCVQQTWSESHRRAVICTLSFRGIPEASFTTWTSPNKALCNLPETCTANLLLGVEVYNKSLLLYNRKRMWVVRFWLRTSLPLLCAGINDYSECGAMGRTVFLVENFSLKVELWCLGKGRSLHHRSGGGITVHWLLEDAQNQITLLGLLDQRLLIKLLTKALGKLQDLLQEETKHYFLQWRKVTKRLFQFISGTFSSIDS